MRQSVSTTLKEDSDVLKGHVSRASLNISVCIATHERAQLLESALCALKNQSRLPNEIVVSDSSVSKESEAIFQRFAQMQPQIISKYIKSGRKSLPWQRWWAFCHSNGEIILFLDDDIVLRGDAICRLLQVYEQEASDAAGVGFAMAFNDGTLPSKYRSYERWLGISELPAGVISNGGWPTSHVQLSTVGECVEVEWLWGGAMSFKRSVLHRIRPLSHLYALYDQGVGKGEDAVLSNEARRFGRLLLLTGPYALHPPDETAYRSAYSLYGFRKGLLETWGRAHAIRWLARKSSLCLITWMRHVSFELAFLGKTIALAPLQIHIWARLGGTIYGVFFTMMHWKQIPVTPYIDTIVREIL